MTAAGASAALPTTSYDSVAYPSATFRHTHPDRLAVILRLHGLAAPPVETARVLEIGGGAGFNLTALAAAWPRAQFYNFDLSGEAVARGRALVEASGLDNIRIEQADILDVARTIEPGSWDYVIAHGVYAWVPAPVREAVMALAARALAPDGVFFLSYNANPGGRVRQIMREMLFHALKHVTGTRERIRAARAFLEDHAQARPGDFDIVTTFRKQSEVMLKRPDEVLFHDELAENFAPQYLSDVAAAARAHGLDYLNDSGASHLVDGFAADEEESEPDIEALIHAAEGRDFAEIRFFRQSLFVRSGRRPARRPRLDAFEGLLAAGRFQRSDEGGVEVAGTEFVLSDTGLMDRLIELGDIWPAYRPVETLAHNEAQRDALFRLLKIGVLSLTTQPPPFALAVSNRPVASPLVRGQINAGEAHVTTLLFETMRISDPAVRTLLMALDGSRTLADLAPVWAATEHPEEVDLAHALASCAARRLLRP